MVLTGGVFQELRWFLTMGSLALFGVVFVVMFASIWRHHQSNKASNFHTLVVVELFWALIPFVIVGMTLLPSLWVLLDR